MRKKTKKKQSTSYLPSEHEIQSAFTEWVRLTYPDIKAHSIPNGGKLPYSKKVVKGRTIYVCPQRRILLDEGLLPGALDYFIPATRGGFSGLYLEFKDEKGKLSEEQIEFAKFVIRENYCCALVRTFEESKSVVSNYLNNKVKKEKI